MHHIVIIKFEDDFDFDPYLKWLPQHSVTKIMRYKFHKDKCRSFVSELLKECYLPKYLHLPKCTIQYNSYGKPYIAEHIGFNISHSGNYVAMIIANHNFIGIDVEKNDQHINPRDLAPSVLSPAECSLLQYSKNIHLDFFILWTKKEALLKAYGCGFMVNEQHYLNTSLSIDLIDNIPNGVIVSTILDNEYVLSVCELQGIDLATIINN